MSSSPDSTACRDSRPAQDDKAPRARAAEVHASACSHRRPPPLPALSPTSVLPHRRSPPAYSPRRCSSPRGHLRLTSPVWIVDLHRRSTLRRPRCGREGSSAPRRAAISSRYAGRWQFCCYSRKVEGQFGNFKGGCQTEPGEATIFGFGGHFFAPESGIPGRVSGALGQKLFCRPLWHGFAKNGARCRWRIRAKRTLDRDRQAPFSFVRRVQPRADPDRPPCGSPATASTAAACLLFCSNQTKDK
jgi:hypothetical protein